MIAAGLRRGARWLASHVDELSLIAIGAMFFLVASNTQTGWVYLLSAALFGTLITAFFSSRSALRPRGLRLVLPLRVCRGELFPADLRWQAASQRYPSFLTLADPLAVDQAGRSCAMLPATAADAPESALQLWLRSEHRGVWQEAEAALTCYGPLGWFAARRRCPLSLLRPLTVLPATFPVSMTLLERVAGGLTSADHNRGARPGQGDLRRLREYQVGDDVRAIHWPSSARAGTMIVREQAHGGGSHLDLCWGAAQLGPGSAEAFEWLLSWLHSFLRKAQDSGWQVRLWQPAAAGWAPGGDPDGLARAALPAAIGPPPPRDPSAAPRLDFWLGPCSGGPAYEFWPSDYLPGAQLPDGERRIGPGQEPQWA